MMCIQVPGSVAFILSLVGREGVEWSTWLTYAFAGGMQAVLLVSVESNDISSLCGVKLTTQVTGDVRDVEGEAEEAWT